MGGFEDGEEKEEWSGKEMPRLWYVQRIGCSLLQSMRQLPHQFPAREGQKEGWFKRAILLDDWGHYCFIVFSWAYSQNGPLPKPEHSESGENIQGTIIGG